MNQVRPPSNMASSLPRLVWLSSPSCRRSRPSSTQPLPRSPAPSAKIVHTAAGFPSNPLAQKGPDFPPSGPFSNGGLNLLGPSDPRRNCVEFDFDRPTSAQDAAAGKVIRRSVESAAVFEGEAWIHQIDKASSAAADANRLN